MKTCILSLTILSVFLLSQNRVCLSQDSPPEPPGSAESDLLTAIADLKIKPAIIAESRKRDPDASLRRRTEIHTIQRINRKPQILGAAETGQLLCLDFNQPQLHLRCIELAARSLENASPKHSARLNEVIWQEVEYLRLSKADEHLQKKARQITERLAPRRFTPPEKLFQNARKTFEEGYAFHIREAFTSAPQLKPGNGFTRLNLPLHYIRSHKFPPRGCRVVTELLFKVGGEDRLLSHRTDFQPCAFTTGMLNAEFLVFGNLEMEEPPVLLIYVTPQFASGPRSVPASNMLVIPLQVKQPPKEKLQAAR